MKYVYITALVNCRLAETLSSPIELRERTFITNNPSHIEKYLRHHDVMAMGSLEATDLLNGKPVVYRLDKVDKKEQAHVELVNFLRDVQALLSAMWLHRDNSANCEMAFAVSQSSIHVHSNSLALHYSTASGTQEALTLEHRELKDIVDTLLVNFRGVREQDRLPLTSFQKETGRMNVSALFLQQARSSQDLGQKIANYCSFFEALLSTSSAELAHQLSERAAFLLRSSPADRFNHFKSTKRAYAIRSKVVHGDVVSKNQVPDLLDVSKHCDQAARELLRLIIDDQELAELFSGGSGSKLDDYMLGRIFGL